MNKYKTIILIILSTSLVACNSKETQQINHYSKSEVEDFRIINNHSSKVSEYSPIAFIPSYIAMDNDKMGFVSETDKKFELRSNKGEILFKSNPEITPHPQLIAFEEDSIYIYDKLLQKVIEFSLNGTIKNEINVKKIDQTSRYLDLEVIKGDIYFTIDTALKNETGIHKYNQNGEYERSNEGFIGYLSKENNILYAVNTLEYVSTSEEAGGVSGRNSLFKVTDTLEKIIDFKNGYIPLDFIVRGDVLTVISAGLATIDQYSISKKEYVHTLHVFNDATGLIAYLATDGYVFNAILNDSNKMYQIEYKGD